MKIQPIVEGHGEVEAVPILLRRLMAQAGAYSLDIGRPIRQSRSQLLNEASLKKALRLALKQPDCGAVLVLFDSDRDCPLELAPRIESWARDEAGPVPCAVVMAHKEFEAWFLAAVESLRGKCGVRTDAGSHPSPEDVRGAKGRLEDLMAPGRSYMETSDQAKLAAAFDMGAAYAKCRSFRKMISAFGVLARASGGSLDEWPPAAWARGRE